MNVCTNCIYKNACGTVKTACSGRQTISAAKSKLKKAQAAHDEKTAAIYTALIARYENK